MGGPLVTEGYVCAEQGAKLELSDVNLPSLKSTHVEVEIEMVGLCHTDLHMVDNDWGGADYPLLPGHEGVGKVVAKGEEVTELQIGDRVGIAWIRDSCKDCDKCKEGRENMCADYFQGTYLGKSFGPWGRAKERYNEHGGCFVRIQRIEERFAVRIPDNIPSELACPFLCGGSTVYEPIVEFTQPGTRLGVSSIGGLGTLAIKLGKIMGCHVTAISSSAEKEAGARKAGAEIFACTKNEAALEKLKNSLDVIIDTSPANADIGPFLELLRQGGTYVRVGIPPAIDNTFSYQFSFLISYQKRIAGSLVSGSKRMDEMFQIVSDNLEFMMADDEKWKAKVRPMSEINEAMDELKSRTAKGYRQVLAW